MLQYIVVSIVSALVGFGLGLWYCKPVRDELKALRAKAVDVGGGIIKKL